jgi:hypothetical protein
VVQCGGVLKSHFSPIIALHITILSDLFKSYKKYKEGTLFQAKILLPFAKGTHCLNIKSPVPLHNY